MRHFNINPVKPSANNKRYETYIKELDTLTTSFVSYFEMTNPNFMVLNEHFANDADDHPVPDIYSLEDLIKANAIALTVDYSNGSEVLYMVIRVKQLRLHRGLISQYGTNCKICYPEYDDILNYIEYSEYDLHPRLDEVWESYTGKQHYPLNFYYTVDNQDVQYLQPIQQGHVVFRTGSGDTPDNFNIYPIVGRCGAYIPQPQLIKQDNKTIWSWKYMSDASERGSNQIFVFNAPNIRYITTINQSSGTEIDRDTDIRLPEWTQDNHSILTVPAMYLGDSHNLQYYIQAQNNIPWTGFENNILCNRYYWRTKTDNNHFTEEEIFVDDSMNYGSAVLDVYNNPYYTIDVMHEVEFPRDKLYVRIW